METDPAQVLQTRAQQGAKTLDAQKAQVPQDEKTLDAQKTQVPQDEKYDAIIVGAGPAGSSCALFLANSGRKVLLLDKAAFPREKVCGDAFSGKSIGIARELGLLPKLSSLPHGIVRGLTMVSPNGKKVDVPFPNAQGLEFAGYTIERRSLDNLFFQEAKLHKNITTMQNFSVSGLEKTASGSVCGISGTIPGAVADTTGGKGGVAGAVAGSVAGEKRTFYSSVVVGADGSASTISRLLSLPPAPLPHIYTAIRGYYSGISNLTENIELFFIDGVLPGYLWIFPMENGRANVGLGILSSDLKNRKHPNTILQDALSTHPSISSRFQNASLVGKIGAWAIPNGSYKKQNTGEGWLLIGDAASLVDPFSGEGVGNALSSGKYAAQAINSAIKANGTDLPLPSSSLSSYEESVSKYLRPEMQNSHRIQQLSRSKFLLNLFIGKAADKPEVRKMLIDMLGSDEEKEKIVSPLFYLKLLLP